MVKQSSEKGININFYEYSLLYLTRIIYLMPNFSCSLICFDKIFYNQIQSNTDDLTSFLPQWGSLYFPTKSLNGAADRNRFELISLPQSTSPSNLRMFF